MSLVHNVLRYYVIDIFSGTAPSNTVVLHDLYVTSSVVSFILISMLFVTRLCKITQAYRHFHESKSRHHMVVCCAVQETATSHCGYIP